MGYIFCLLASNKNRYSMHHKSPEYNSMMHTYPKRLPSIILFICFTVFSFRTWIQMCNIDFFTFLYFFTIRIGNIEVFKLSIFPTIIWFVNLVTIQVDYIKMAVIVYSFWCFPYFYPSLSQISYFRLYICKVSTCQQQ